MRKQSRKLTESELSTITTSLNRCDKDKRQNVIRSHAGVICKVEVNTMGWGRVEGPGKGTRTRGEYTERIGRQAPGICQPEPNT
jgi:hypothetical protein